MYSDIQIQRLQSSFSQGGITLDVKADHIIVENSEQVTEKKICAYIKQAGFCPLISENKIDGKFVFTIVPYNPPNSFRFLIPSVDSSYKNGNEELIDIALKNLKGYETHFKNNKTNILFFSEGMRGTALFLGYGNGSDIPLVEIADQFDQIDIVDIDLSAMSKAIDGFPPLIQQKIRLIKQDLTGLTSYVSKKLAEFDFNVPEMKCLENAAKLFEESIKHAEPVTFSKRYNFVVSSMLTSQLYSNIQGYVLEVLDKKYPKIKEKADQKPNLCPSWHATTQKLTEFLCLKHMDHLAEWTLPSGRAYFADTVQLDYVVFMESKALNGQTVISPQREEGGDILPNNEIHQKILDSFNQIGLTRSWDWTTRLPTVLSQVKVGNVMKVMAICLQPKS